MPLSEILEQIADADGAYYPTVNSEGDMTGIFSVNDIRRILAEDIPPGLILARDMANANVITARPDETLTEVLRKLTSRGLEEIPVLNITDPQKVHFMLSRRAVLARYASELEKQKGLYSEI
jgi:CIC family chloride channel protein